MLVNVPECSSNIVLTFEPNGKNQSETVRVLKGGIDDEAH